MDSAPAALFVCGKLKPMPPRPLLPLLLPVLLVAGCASPQPDARSTTPIARGTAMDASNGNDPFVRLPAPRLPAPAGLPPLDLGPVAPPLVNEVSLAFPPEAARVAPPRLALPAPEVVRVSPEGSAGTQGTVTVAFSQPMVPLASVGQLNAGPSPLALTPRAEGRGRWIDPRTFSLEAAGRLRYSTSYRASVPAGLTAADGQPLALGRAWTFTTELAQRLQESRPWNAQGGLELRPLIQLRFLGTMEAGLASKALRLDEKESHRSVPIEVLPGVPAHGPRLVESWWDADKSLAIKPREALRPGTHYRLVLPRSLATPEGPNTGEHDQVIEFETYAPFALQALDCAERKPGECLPGAPVWARFNNAFAPGQKVGAFASVTPAPQDLQIIDNGSQVTFQGSFAPSTAYTFTIKPGLRDVFGQSLAKGLTKTLRFGALDPLLRLEGAGSIVVVESEVSRKLGVDSVNIPEFTVRSALVGSESLERAERWTMRWAPEANDPLALLPETARRLIKPGGAQNQPVHTELDLVPLLGGARFGAAILDVVTSEKGQSEAERATHALVQVTDLSVLVLASPERLHVAVSRFSTGGAVAGAAVVVRGAKGEKLLEGATDAEGRLSLAGPRGVKEPRLPWTLVTQSGEDRVLLPLRQGPIGNGFSMAASADYLQIPAPSLVTTAFADRGIYRPGEEARIVLVARQQTHGLGGDLIPLPPEAFTWALHGPRGEVARGEVSTDAFGFASVALKLDGPNLGQHQISFARKAGDQGAAGASFRVEEYRPPEFLAGAAIEAPSPAYLRGEAGGRVTGRYLFGAPMAGAGVHWEVTRLPADYAPPHWDTFTFRRVERWSWRGEGIGGRFWPHREDPGVHVASGDGALDGEGALALTFPLAADGALQAQRFSLSATVTDKNRQAGGAGAALLAHPSQLVVGLRLATTVVPVGGKVEAEVIVTDLDGRPIPQRKVALTLSHEPWGGGDVEPAVAAEVQSGAAPVKAALVPTKAGAWTLTALVHDEQGGAHLAAIPVWIVGPDFKQDGEPQLQVILDKASYAPGDTVRALVLSPFPRARGSWALAREGFLEVKPLVLEGSTALLEFRAEDAWVPNAELVIALAQPRVKPPGLHDDDGRPKLVTVTKSITIDKRLRTLEVQVTPAAPIAAPGTEATLRLAVKDAAGRGRATQLTVMVVDEGVLAMTGYLTPRVIDALYPARPAGIGGTSTSERVLPREPRDFAAELQQQSEALSVDRAGGPRQSMAMRAPPSPAMAMKEMAEVAGPGAGQGPVFAVRQGFSSAPWFKADLRSGPDGRAEVAFKLPDNLTEFRVMVVAADEARAFGAGESRIVVRRPVLVRPSLPRFLNVGDHFEAAATVHNETGSEADLEVICRAANATVQGPRQRLHLKSGESREVRFHAEAGAPGPAKFQFAAVALIPSQPTDAAEVIIPTRIPATAEAFASYGQTEGAEKLAVELPEGALPGYGGLELQLSSTALTGLSDAIDYLVDYPFGCAEQTASRILPLAALKDVLVSLKLASVTNEQKRSALLDEAVRHLLTLQRGDGGFGLWASTDRSGLWLTAYATLALDLAQRAGAAMPDGSADKLQSAIRFLGGRLAQKQSKEWDDNDESRSLAALVLTRRGEFVVNELRRLIKQPDLALFAVAWTMQAAALGKLADVEEEGHRRLNNAAVESAGTVHFAERASESLRLLMHSDDRTDGIVLGALLTARPNDPLIDKTVRGLMRLRAKGRWSTTQSNAWALIALSDYFKVYEAAAPDFLARLWYGEGLIAAQAFKGRSTDAIRGTVPFSKLGASKADLTIAKQGPGRLYYRVGLRYAPASTVLKPLDQGFIVSRTYEGLKNPSDVTRDADGTWHVKAGATVRVRLKVTSPDRRYYAAIIDPLPAGFEILDTSLATSAREDERDPASGNGKPWWAWWSPWSHTELKDDRLQLFADTLWAGDYQHGYLVRATTPGRFVAPPPRAEEMYAPETFGRGQSDVVVVE